MWKNGLTENTLAVFEEVSTLECIKNLHLCGGTGIAVQLNHRLSEDLDFEILTYRGQLKDLDSAAIVSELEKKFKDLKVIYKGSCGDQFECEIGDHVKLSFFRPKYKVPELNEVLVHNNLKTVSLQDALGMKLFTITQRSKFRDYYDIYSLLKAGCSLKTGIDYAIRFARHNISSKFVITKLLASNDFVEREKEGFYSSALLNLKYNVTEKDICHFIELKLSEINISKTKRDLTVCKSVGRLFYETFTKLDDKQLVYVMDELPKFSEERTSDGKVGFMNRLLVSIGAKVTPYDKMDSDLLELRKRKDMESLSRVTDVLNEYNSFLSLSSEIEKQNNAIEGIKLSPVDDSVKTTMIANAAEKINDLKQRQKDLQFCNEFVRLGRMKELSRFDLQTSLGDQRKKPLDFSELDNKDDDDKDMKRRMKL